MERPNDHYRRGLRCLPWRGLSRMARGPYVGPYLQVATVTGSPVHAVLLAGLYFAPFLALYLGFQVLFRAWEGLEEWRWARARHRFAHAQVPRPRVFGNATGTPDPAVITSADRAAIARQVARAWQRDQQRQREIAEGIKRDLSGGERS